MVIVYLMLALRALVFITFVIAAIVAGAHWAVKNGHLTAFSPFARFARRLGEPFTKPLERRMLKSGGNPTSAPYLFFWVALLGGLALIGIVQWLIATGFTLISSAQAGPAGLLFFLVNGAFSLVIAAIFIRVIASWFGVSPYSKPMRVVYALTDWIVEPIRKVIPPVGMIDVTPMIALLLLWVARGVVLSFF